MRHRRAAGLAGWHFAWLPWLIVTLGLFLAHGTNNLLNDYTDFSRGVDKDNYFRTQYGVHPLVQGFWTKRQQLSWFLVSGVLAFLAGVFALFYTDFSPVVIGLFAFGAVVLLFYTWPLKYLGAGRAVHLPDLGADPGRRACTPCWPRAGRIIPGRWPWRVCPSG